MIEMLSSLALGLVDTAFVGHLGADALTAVGLSIRVMMVTVTLFTVLAAGAQILISQYYGANKLQKSQRTAETFFFGDFILGLFFAAGWIFFAPKILSAMGADKNVLIIGVNYVRAIGLVGFFGTFMYVPSTVLKVVGRTWLTLIIATIVNITNLFFDYVLIFGKWGFPEFGVTGAGLATALGHLAGGITAILIFKFGNIPFKFSIKGIINPDFKLMRKILDIGIPASIEFLAYHLGQMALVRMTAFLGTDAVAIFQLVTRLMGLSYMVVFGVATAALALVGQSIGANDD